MLVSEKWRLKALAVMWMNVMKLPLFADTEIAKTYPGHTCANAILDLGLLMALVMTSMSAKRNKSSVVSTVVA